MEAPHESDVGNCREVPDVETVVGVDHGCGGVTELSRRFGWE